MKRRSTHTQHCQRKAKGQSSVFNVSMRYRDLHINSMSVLDKRGITSLTESETKVCKLFTYRWSGRTVQQIQRCWVKSS